MDKYPCILSLGSNIEDRLTYLNKAIEALGDLGNITAISPIFESKAWGMTAQQDFLNLVLLMHTPMEAKTLLRAVKNIELKIGRKHRLKWHQREIDIDIIFYHNQIIHEDNLTIPHPHFHLRNFVLKPLYSLAPNWIDPKTNQSVTEILAQCPDQSQVEETELKITIA